MSVTQGGPKGTACYKELWGDRPMYSVKSDIFALGSGPPSISYSFFLQNLGMCFFELFSGGPPFADVQRPVLIMGKIVSGKLPALPHSVPRNVRNLVVGCVQPDRHSRPTAAQLLDQICILIDLKSSRRKKGEAGGTISGESGLKALYARRAQGMHRGCFRPCTGSATG